MFKLLIFFKHLKVCKVYILFFLYKSFGFLIPSKFFFVFPIALSLIVLKLKPQTTISHMFANCINFNPIKNRFYFFISSLNQWLNFFTFITLSSFFFFLSPRFYCVSSIILATAEAKEWKRTFTCWKSCSYACCL